MRDSEEFSTRVSGAVRDIHKFAHRLKKVNNCHCRLQKRLEPFFISMGEGDHVAHIMLWGDASKHSHRPELFHSVGPFALKL